jgi:hypothetical protein
MPKSQQNNHFVAGTSFTPLPGGLTRVKTYAAGGRVLSEEILPSSEVIRRLEAANREAQHAASRPARP